LRSAEDLSELVPREGDLPLIAKSQPMTTVRHVVSRIEELALAHQRPRHAP
jgi:hypothetical protein